MQLFNPNKREIFDSHSHIGRFGSWTMKGHLVEPFRRREIASAQDQADYMEGNGISRAIVMPHYTPDQSVPFAVYNPLVLETTAKVKGVLGALWVSPLQENRRYLQAVLSGLPHAGIVALKISPDSWPEGKYTPNPRTWDSPFTEGMLDIIDACKKHNLVLHCHTGSGNSDMKEYTPFIEEYGKKTTLQLVHMGGSSGGHFSFVPQFIGWLKEGYKLYCDTSSFARGFAPAWLVQELIDYYPAGLKRVLFASDNPWGLFESEFWKIEGIGCKEGIKTMIFSGNAKELYLG